MTPAGPRAPTHRTPGAKAHPGRTASGTRIADRIEVSHWSVWRFISMVRPALVTSVTCTPPSVPPVSFQISHESIVPKAISPASARARRPGTLSSSQAALGPEK
ncbi:hypothetical protein SRIMHP_06620 [Streptomyces rimosus subsp. rimosus]|nr:hypothetical protein SRIMHP_06620 [Streptomyces rimosus subsp. rimosus]UTJ11887.1 hypothetical protein SRIMDV3_06515 [Streptomyces rimosus subsp. rimosus]